MTISKKIKKISALRDVIPFKKMTIEYLKNRKGQLFFIEPNEFFVNGLKFDEYSQTVFLAAYEALNEKDKNKMKKEILTKNPYKFILIIKDIKRFIKPNKDD